MNAHTASNLDIEKFRKVHALVRGGATVGERAAAKARASKIAERAGLTFDQAVSKLDRKPDQPKTSNFFSDLFNSPEFRAQQSERDRESAIRRAKLMKEYGSKDAVFTDTENEALLSRAVEHLKDWQDWSNPDGTIQKVVCGIDGWSGWSKELPRSVRSAVSDAYPVSSDLAGVLAEYKAWDKLYLDRNAFGTFEHWYWVDARILILHEILNTRPVRDWGDMLARLDWWEFELLSDVYSDRDGILRFQRRIVADMAILMAGSFDAGCSGEPTRRTNADKRDAVLSMLDASPNLSDREIARQVGVSPQTVGNWRKRVNDTVSHP